MRLALGVGYFGTGLDAQGVLSVTKEADRLGYHSVWVAEAYGSDAVTVLSWLAGQTEKIGLASGILQMTARAPTMTAMTAATLDMISGGRVLLGLGLSGPQVVEGWYGQRYRSPLRFTREYVEIVRKVIAREEPLTYQGEVFELPLKDSQGKALKLITHPVRPSIPIYLASIGPKNIALTAEIAEGWLPAFYSPDWMDLFLPALKEGTARAGRDLSSLDIAPTAFVSMGADLESCYDWLRPMFGLYLGGMGSRKDNFYVNLASRYGFADEAARVQELYLSGDKMGAYRAVPEELMDATALVGPIERIAERMKRYEAAGVTTLVTIPIAGSVEDRVETLRKLRDVIPVA